MAQVMTRQEAAVIIGICRKQLGEWIKRDELDIPPRTLLTPIHQKTLFDKYGIKTELPNHTNRNSKLH
jgi:hypothetical protein